MKTPKLKKAKPLIPRPTLRFLPAHEANLYEAVAQYVEFGGGKAVIIGGIEIQKWPSDPAGKHRVAVHFLGKAPKFPKK